MHLSLLLCIGFVFASASADSCEKNLCSSTEGCPLAKNTLLTTLPQLNKEFFVSFEFRATAWQSGWQNVIHFTSTGDNCCDVGDRVPGFWVSNSGQLHPCFAVGDNGNYATLTTKEYSLNTWHSVEFSQTLKNGKYMYRVVVDGEDVIAPVENTKPTKFSNVKVFAADSWFTPVQGSIRNLLVNTDSSNGCGGSPPAPSGCSCSDETEETHQGTAGRCLTQYKGKYFCYVENGAASKCPDKQESIRAAKWWSYQACDSYEAPPITG